jgi:hypothetical protein
MGIFDSVEERHMAAAARFSIRGPVRCLARPWRLLGDGQALREQGRAARGLS